VPTCQAELLDVMVQGNINRGRTDKGEKANKYSSNGQDDQDGGWVNVSSGTGSAS